MRFAGGSVKAAGLDAATRFNRHWVTPRQARAKKQRLSTCPLTTRRLRTTSPFDVGIRSIWN